MSEEAVQKRLGMTKAFWEGISLISLLPLGLSFFGAGVSWWQAQNAREGDIVARLDKAAGQLGSSDIPQRLRGVREMERAARESPGDYWPVMELLTAVVRDRAGASKPQVQAEEGQPVSVDVQAILDVLGRRNRPKSESHAAEEWKNPHEVLDLHNTVLREANLYQADLSRAELWGCDLAGTNLREADLRKANLLWSDLRRADLTDANLTGAQYNEEVGKSPGTQWPEGFDPAAHGAVPVR